MKLKVRSAPSLVARLLIVQMGMAVAVASALLWYSGAAVLERLDERLLFAASVIGSQASPSMSETEAGDIASGRVFDQTKQSSLEFAVPYRPELVFQAFDRTGRMYARSRDAPMTPMLPLLSVVQPALFKQPLREQHPEQMERQRTPPSIAKRVDVAVPANLPEANALFEPSGFSDALPLLQVPPPEFGEVEVDGARWRVVRTLSGLGREFQAAEPLRWRRDAVVATLMPLLVRCAWILPLFFLGTWLIARYTMTPMHKLARLIAARPAADLSSLTPEPSYTETVPVVQEINRLLMRLRQMVAVERASFADAAHELLTPLAAVQAQAYELASAGDESARSQAARELDRGLERVSALIRQLLLLARAGPASESIVLTEQDLIPVIQERVAAAATRALAKGIDIALEAPPELQAGFHRELLIAAADNLLDNAVRYCPPGSQIVIKLHRKESLLELSVADDGPGIAAEHVGRIFERYFRVPGTADPGSGLGLAIVKRVAQLHGGTVTSGPGLQGRGLEVCVRWGGSGVTEQGDSH